MFLEGSRPSCPVPIHPRGLLKVEKIHRVPPFLPTNRALMSGPRLGGSTPCPEMRAGSTEGAVSFPTEPLLTWGGEAYTKDPQC